MRTLLVAVFCLVPLVAQEKEPAKRPPPTPKNLKVLKVPPTELIPTMRTYTAGLGVQCNFCHVQGNFAADDNPKKEIARGMITMAEEINGKFHDGKVHVTCYTCHRGETTPKMAAAPAAPPAN